MKNLLDSRKSMREGLLLGTASSIEVAKVAGGGYIFKGVATATSVVDRMRRVFLPGAFEPLAAQVPLLAFHNDARPVGVSKFTQTGSVVRHESRLSNIEYAAELEQLIKDGAIPATSIGWVSDEMYWGIGELTDKRPDLIPVLEKNNIPMESDIIYFAKAEILENSLTPIPANPLALISVASMMGGREKGMVEAMLEIQQAALGIAPKTPAPVVKTPVDFSVAVKLAGAVRSMFTMSFPARKAKYTDSEFEAAFDKNMEEMLNLTTDVLRAEGVFKAASDPDENIATLAQAVDQVLDDALTHHAAGEDEEAWALVTAADQSADELLEVLNVSDPDETGEAAVKPPAVADAPTTPVSDQVKGTEGAQFVDLEIAALDSLGQELATLETPA